MKHIKATIIGLSSLLATSFSNADFENASYSYFSAGVSLTSYSEALPNFAGASFESDFSSTALVQRSGGYTALSDDGNLGFFIATQSTLLATEGDEDWNVKGVTGVSNGSSVQVDQVSMNHGVLDLLGVYHLRNGYFLTAGMHYQKIAFSRFDFTSTSDTAAFSTFTLANSTTYQNILQEITDNGSYTYSNGVVATTPAEAQAQSEFNPEAQTPVVSEDLTTFSVVGGIGFDSYFINKNPGFRYKYDVTFGIPVFVSVLNTNLGGTDRSISEAFSGGIDLNGNISAGYQINEKVSIMGSVSFIYSERDTISTESAIGQKVSLPNNTYTSITPEITFYWAF